MDKKENQEIVSVKESSFLRPLISIDEAVEVFNEYQRLKKKLRGEGDFIEFTDRQGNKKEAPTKQWRAKLTRFFGISTQIISESVEYLPDGSFVVKVVVRATAPNGLFCDGDGSCWSKTKEETDRRGNLRDIYHNTRSHAITRAKNRAVLELVGFGEVSAEEIGEEVEEKNVINIDKNNYVVHEEKIQSQNTKDIPNRKEYWTSIWNIIKQNKLDVDKICQAFGVQYLKDIPADLLPSLWDIVNLMATGDLKIEKIMERTSAKLKDLSREEIELLLDYEPEGEEE